MSTVPLSASNRIWQTYSHFPYKAWHAIAELVDNSTQAYFDNRVKVDAELDRVDQKFEVRIDFDRNRLLSVWDNSIGMDLLDLKRAVQLASPPPDTSGRSEFGMGMKTACCWLGDNWSIITTKLGSSTEYTVKIDVNEIAASDAHEIDVIEKVADENEHYTRIEVRDLHRQMPGRTLGAVRRHLVSMYRRDISNGEMVLKWDGRALEPETTEALVTEDGGVPTEWKKDVDFEVSGKRVYGWVCILAKGGRGQAGFDLFRRGRVILGRPTGYRPHKIFGEMRNDLINQRLYGELNLDDFPVNHLKDDFLWDGMEDELQEKLSEVCGDYVSFAKSYRSTKKKVDTPVVHAANDEIAEELNEAQMLDHLTVAEVEPDIPLEDEAILDSKAEKLREQKIDPKIVEIGKFTFRIFHPEDMPGSETYFFRRSSGSNEVDIFINDNHPYVLKGTDESDYVMFVRMCVVDAIAEHVLVNRGSGEPMSPQIVAKVKDQILRGFPI